MATPEDQSPPSPAEIEPSTDSSDNTIAASDSTQAQLTQAHSTQAQPAQAQSTPVQSPLDEASANTRIESQTKIEPLPIALRPATRAMDSAATRPHLDGMTQPISADHFAELHPQPPPPRKVGSYEILEEIARGGMGIVYKAHQRGLNRIVALKMTLTGDFTGDQERERFRLEAEAAGKLDHPAIVPIYEVSEHEGRPFFSMGFVDGQSLKELLSSGPIAPRRAAEIILKVAQAVDYAHSRGVVHRDLKPANILLDSSGLPRITDFGLAKQVSTDSELTTTGQILGTPSFMPPEQAQGKIDQVGPLSDVYSLGATLYCLLTGRPPFQAASLMDTLYQVAHQEPVSPRSLDSTIPRDVETICLKCLEKSPSRRYASSGELADDLGRFLNGEPVHARPLSRAGRAWRWCRRKPLAASLIATSCLLMLVISVGVWYRLQYAATSRQLLLTEKLKRVSDYHAGMSRARELNARLQPGSTWLVEKELAQIADLIPDPTDQAEYDALLSDVQSRYDVRKISSSSHNMHVGTLAFSPDGKRLAIGQRKHSTGFTVNIYDTAQIPLAWGVRTTSTPLPTPIASYTVSTLGTSFSQLLSGSTRYQDGARCLAWSPDSKWLVVGSRFGKLTRWDTSRADSEGITWSAGEREITRLSFSADGQKLLSKSDKWKQWDLATDWREEPVANNNLDANAVSPDGQFLADIDKQDRLTIQELVTGGLFQTFPPPDGEYYMERESLAFIAGGRLLVGKDNLRRLHFWDVATGREATQPIGSADDALQWTYSAAKNWLVLTDVESKDLLQIYEVRSPQSVNSFLQAGQPRAIEFSPDGQQLAVVSTSTITASAVPWTELSRWSLNSSTAPWRLRATHHAHDKLVPLPTISWHPQKASVAWFAGMDGLMVSDLRASAGQSGESKPHQLLLRSDRDDTEPISLAEQAGNAPQLQSLLQLKELKVLADEGSLPARWSVDGKHLWGFIGANKRLVAWDGESLKPVASWSNKLSDISTGQATISSFGLNSQYIVCGGEDGYVTVLPARPSSQPSSSESRQTIIPINHFFGPGGPIKAIEVGAGNSASTSHASWVAIATQTGSVQFRTLPAGELISEIQLDNGSVETIAFNAARQLLATGGEDGAVRLYQINADMQGQPLITFTARIGTISQLRLSPDGQRLAAIGRQSKSVIIWDLSTLRVKPLSSEQ